MRISFSVLFSFLLIAVAAQNNKKDFTRYVNPFIGSASQANSLSGSVFPGACMPFGMVQLSPDNFDAPEEPASAYDYVQKTIVGFSHTHLNGTGVGDLYDIMVQPLTGTPLWQPGDAAKPRSGYRSSFSHTTEKASPGYYAVRLDDYDVNVKLTATVHVGFHQYKFPKTDSAYVLFDLDHTLDKKRSYWSCKIVAAHMKQVDAYTIEGYRILTGWARLRKVYFVVKFDQPIQQGFFVNGRRVFTDAGVVNGNSSKAAFRFNSKQGSTVKMKVALSATSTSDAYKTLLPNYRAGILPPQWPTQKPPGMSCYRLPMWKEPMRRNRFFIPASTGISSSPITSPMQMGRIRELILPPVRRMTTLIIPPSLYGIHTGPHIHYIHCWHRKKMGLSSTACFANMIRMVIYPSGNYGAMRITA